MSLRGEIAMQETFSRFKCKVKLLLVDNSKQVRETYSGAIMRLQNFANFEITDILEAKDSDTALELIDNTPPDFILLDNQLKQKNSTPSALDGEELCRAIREKGVKCPVIIFSGAWTSSDHKVGGLGAGAIDYHEKDESIHTLLAKIERYLTAYERSEDAVYRIGPWIFKPSENWIKLPESRRCGLTGKESGILKFLYRARGAVVEKKVLLNEVWSYNERVETHTLETHIYRLRKKLYDDKNPRYILTAAGGYRLMT